MTWSNIVELGIMGRGAVWDEGWVWKSSKMLTSSI